MDQNLKEILIYQIQKGKNLNNLDIKFIEEKLNTFFLREGNLRKKIEIEYNKIQKKNNGRLTAANGSFKKFKNKFLSLSEQVHEVPLKKTLLKNKIFKEIVKKVRAEIGQVYTQFLTTNFKKKEKNLEDCKTKKDALQILKLHKSTKERINYYEKVYGKIFEWYKPKYIADLACGLNPISYSIIEEVLKYSPKYFASDLGIEDMNFLNIYFKKFKINGIAKNIEITNLGILKDKYFMKSDLIFLFKALDSFEEIKKNISKKLLEKIPAKNIVISFPTKSLISKKHIKINKRNWIINFIKKQNWKLEQFEVENEIFFLVEKKCL